jgi:type IV secretion system protein VirB3
MARETAQVDPLFVGATRPATVGGITYEAIVFIAMAVGMGYVITANFLWLLAYAPLHAIAYGICKKDPRAFRLLFLMLASKGRCMNRAIWGCASYSQLPFRKRK